MFDLTLKNNTKIIPHYTIRFPGNKVIISYRLFTADNAIIENIQTFFQKKEIEYRIDPIEPDKFARFHCWINKNSIATQGTEERCQHLHKISSFIVTNFTDETLDDDKFQWCHLFSNMIGIFDEFKVVRTLNNEYKKLPYSFTIDISQLEPYFK